MQLPPNIRRTALGVAGLLLAAIALASCDSGGGDGQPGDEGFRAFAAEIQEALTGRDASWFHERALLQTGVCTAEDLTPTIGQPPCEEEGQPWQGFPVGYWRSEGAYSNAEAATNDILLDTLPEETDVFGDGEMRIYALTLGETGGFGGPEGGEAYRAIITALIDRPANFAGSGPLRVARVTTWSFEGERWRMIALLSANVLAEEFLIPCPVAVDVPVWERYPNPNAPPAGGTCLE